MRECAVQVSGPSLLLSFLLCMRGAGCDSIFNRWSMCCMGFSYTMVLLLLGTQEDANQATNTIMFLFLAISQASHCEPLTDTSDGLQYCEQSR